MTPLSDAELEALQPRELLQLGSDLFNAGEYFEAHEAWEEVWLGAPPPLRAFYQGLIQVAAALVHLGRNEFPGTEHLLEEGVAKLEKYTPDFLGVDTARLVTEATATRAEVLALGPKHLRRVKASTLPKVHALSVGESRSVRLDGLTLHWLEWSRERAPHRRGRHDVEPHEISSATILLLHAPAHLARLWLPVAARLGASGNRVLVPDLPGHGASESTEDALEDVDLLHRWLAAIGADARLIAGFGPSAGVAARLAAAMGSQDVQIAPAERTGPGDGDILPQRRLVWPSQYDMYTTLARRAQFARWRPDLLWTYAEYGTRPVDGGIELLCSNETEARWLTLGRPADVTLQVEASPLVEPVAVAEALTAMISALE